MTHEHANELGLHNSILTREQLKQHSPTYANVTVSKRKTELMHLGKTCLANGKNELTGQTVHATINCLVRLADKPWLKVLLADLL